MKCSSYDPDAYGCMSPLTHGRCPNVSERRCENGWLTFWTPAERAGLKALGRRLLLAIHYKAPATMVLESAIKEYVAAARKSKEWIE